VDRDARSLAPVSAAGQPERDPSERIVVIGGGWAGCAATVELARRGHRVELHEAAPALGGRARRVVRDGLPLDNGEHLLLGAYGETIALAAGIRDASSPAPWTIAPLAMRPFAPTQRNALSLSLHALPAALGPLAGLVGARGLDWRERAATLGWFARQWRVRYRCDARASVAAVLGGLPARVRENLFNPLCVAALNTPPERASAQIFLNVLRETFGTGGRATALVAPRAGLADAVPEQAAQWLVAHGHAVRTSTRTRIAAIDATGVTLESSGASVRADAVVVAVGPHQLAATFAPGLADARAPIAQALADVARFDYEPISTLYLGYDAPVALGSGLLRLDDAPGQWLFDRTDILRRATPSADRPDLRALVSVVISASGPHASLEHPALVTAVDAQLHRLAPGFPALRWSQVIDERRATYACAPALPRPACGALCNAVYLAGDYTYAEFPATLEAAVRSGLAAARAVPPPGAGPRPAA
jgi:squalene-associated FAD-dependent desaturase